MMCLSEGTDAESIELPDAMSGYMDCKRGMLERGGL